MRPGVNCTKGSISLPFSMPFPMSNVASDLATVSQTDDSARSRPGQIRRPKPKMKLLGCGGGSEVRKRSGLKVMGSV